MAIEQVKIRAQDLVIGMFVSGLDRPWSETPFPLQGFHIRRPEDIERVRAYATYVYVDITKGVSPSPGTPIYHQRSDEERDFRPGDAPLAVRGRRPPKPPPPPAARAFAVREGLYAKTVPLAREAPRAERIARELKATLTLFAKQVVKGRPARLADLAAVVDELVASCLRCPDALLWLVRLRHKDQHTHDHSLRCAVLCAQFGRHVGLPPEEIRLLCLAALLKDIGKLRIPRTVLLKAPEARTPHEEAQYRRFVEHGVEMLAPLPDMEPRVVAAVRCHCERHDGSGFPQGLAGARIPLPARIVGLSTEYDQIASPRGAREPVAPSRAVSLLYNQRNRGFQEELVVAFIRAIGPYPPGTLVELTTGDLAVVMEQEPDARLTPVVAVLDRDAPAIAENSLFVDLRDEAEARRRLLESGREEVFQLSRLAIARDLEPAAYEIDLAALSAAYLAAGSPRGTPAGRGWGRRALSRFWRR
ncbi:MAG: hypothetical protein KatS3mg124_0499 [Porticoccaceae bacterium]|nr:MAG: hypothetical protein KatS3mg124_0499 [Porticoccaceae bacterium]